MWLVRSIVTLVTIHVALTVLEPSCNLPGYDASSLFNIWDGHRKPYDDDFRDLLFYDTSSFPRGTCWMFHVLSSVCLPTNSCSVYFSFNTTCPSSNASDKDTLYWSSNYSCLQTGSGFTIEWIKDNCSLQMVLNCSLTAQWNDPEGNVSAYLTYFNRTLDSQCQFITHLSYSGACRRTTIATPTTASHKKSNHRRLAVVVIVAIFIVLLSVILFYLLVGLIFQIGIKKERGIKMIPNYDFWSSTCNHVMCYNRCKRSGPNYTTFGQEPDDQDL